MAKKVGFKGPSAAQPGSNPGDLATSFFSGENWAVQAVTLLGDGEKVPVAALGFVSVWILFVLRFTIFYGAFGTD